MHVGKVSYRGVAQPGSAPALGAGSRRFKSSRPDQPSLQTGHLLLITVYVLKGDTGKRYIGITNDLSRRLNEHRSGHSKAGQIIGSFGVIHTDTFADHNSSRLREKFLKSGQGRKWLDKLEAESGPAKKSGG